METLDSRDLQEELDELREERADDAQAGDFSDPDTVERIEAIEALAEELDGYGWEHGIQLIPVRDFTEYAQELAEDCGDIPSAGSDRWPLYCIDWEYAARELAHDYSIVEFEGTDYYWREA